MSESPPPSNHIDIEGVQVAFPYEPYKIQLDFMREVVLCCKNVSY